MHPRESLESLEAPCVGYDSLAGISRSSSLLSRARVYVCVRASRSRPRHVTSNRKLGRDFQSRNESPFCLVHDGVALTRERASERRAKRVPSSAAARRGRSRYPRGEISGRPKREGGRRAVPWNERAGRARERERERARSSARKTWSGNTIDERSIARAPLILAIYKPAALVQSFYLFPSSKLSSLSLPLHLLLQLPHLSRRVSFHLLDALRDLPGVLEYVHPVM